APSWRAHQPLPVYQRRFGISPLTWLAAEIRAQIFLPPHFSRPCFHARQVSIRTQGVEDSLLNCRRRSRRREIRLLFRVPNLAKSSGPAPFPVLDRQCFDEFIFQPLVSQQIEPLTDNGRRRIALANLTHLPLQARSALRPLFEQTGF